MTYFKRVLLLLVLSLPVFAGQTSAPDFAHINDVKVKQARFFSYLLPFVRQSNQAILADRDEVKRFETVWNKDHRLSQQQHAWLHAKARQYHMTRFEESRSADWQALLTRVDEVPASMVLAQAANESAWGTSRFARLGSNYFGQWCYSKGCGVVPLKRAKGAHHEVERFSSPLASVKSYMYNLNTHASYVLFRELRAQARQQHTTLKGVVLAKGLVNYSQRRDAYVKSIQSIIRVHRLGQYDLA